MKKLDKIRVEGDGDTIVIDVPLPTGVGKLTVKFYIDNRYIVHHEAILDYQNKDGYDKTDESGIAYSGVMAHGVN